jgi:Transposase DDE domain
MLALSLRGFVFTKRPMALKDISAVDILGFPFFTHCTRASVSDDVGLIEMLCYNIDYFKTKPMELPKITILLDHGYHPDQIVQALEQIYPQIMTKIQFELSAKPSKAAKEALNRSGFVPVAARWVIERSNAWVERKSLVKNFDRTLERANAKLKLCLIRLMLKRLAAQTTT